MKAGIILIMWFGFVFFFLCALKWSVKRRDQVLEDDPRIMQPGKEIAKCQTNAVFAKRSRKKAKNFVNADTNSADQKPIANVRNALNLNQKQLSQTFPTRQTAAAKNSEVCLKSVCLTAAALLFVLIFGAYWILPFLQRVAAAILK